jgi:hypothetical protein
MSLSKFVRTHEIGFIREETNEISQRCSLILRDLRAMRAQVEKAIGKKRTNSV